VYGCCYEHDATLEYLLLRRKEPLIDLGLARFAHSERAINTVYFRGGAGIKCAALLNPHLGYTKCNGLMYGSFSLIREAAHHGSLAEKESVAKNINLPEKYIEEILSRNGLFSKISDEEYMKFLVWLGQNPRMKTDYKKTGQLDYSDGHTSYAHDRVFYAAWDLARKLPPTQEYAFALHGLLSGTHTIKAFDDVSEVLKRWRIEKEAASGKLNYSCSYDLRRRIADSMWPNDDLLNSNDFALRESFYRRFHAFSYSDWTSFIEKDGINAFNALIWNESLWVSEENRQKLSDFAYYKNLDSDDFSKPINAYKVAEKFMRDNHPRFFRDEDLRLSDSTEKMAR
jgi:hypothetical protein